MPIFRDAFAAPVLRSRRSLPYLGGRSTAAGIDVTPERALQIAAVYACVRTHAEDVAGLPIGLYRRRPGSRVRVENNPVMRLLTDEPNPAMDAVEFWQLITGWEAIRGNAFVFVERNSAGMPVGLWPISPTSVQANRITDATASSPSRRGLFSYRVTLTDNDYAPIPDDGIVQYENMLHFKLFGLGPIGLSPIGLARQQIGIAFAASEYIGGFFKRDASPGGVVTVPGELTDAQFQRLEAQWLDMHEGFDKSHRLAVLEGGAKWEGVSLSPADAAFLEIMKFGRTEIAAIYRMPPHKVGDLDRATFSNIEQQAIEYVAGLVPYLTRHERVARRLFADDKSLYVKIDPKGLLRGDVASRNQAYAVARQWGWMSVNDIRRDEDEDPVDGGDEYLQPLNMAPVGSPLPTAQRTAPTPGAFRRRQYRAVKSPADRAPGAVRRLRRTLRAFFDEQHDALFDQLVGEQRVARAVTNPELLDEWTGRLASALEPEFGDVAADFAARVVDQLGGEFNPDRIVNFIAAAAARQARNINQTTFDQVRAALIGLDDETTPAEAVDAVFNEARDSRSGLVAAAAVTAMGSFGEHEGARQAGANEKTWLTGGPNPRPSHARMNGETVPMEDAFSNGCRWPGDPDGGVDEVAGCNCGVQFHV